MDPGKSVEAEIVSRQGPSLHTTKSSTSGHSAGNVPRLCAIIFDFDGVVADNEPIHFAMFQKVLGEIGVPFTEEDYYTHYLGYNDKGCFAAALEANGRPAPADLVQELVSRKARQYLASIKQHLVIFPGVQDVVRRAASRYRLGIASGALRQEIELVLEQAGIRKEFQHITSAEDVTRGKPDPAGYLHALAGLNRTATPGQAPLTAGDCLVIEDSLPGIRAGLAAGMKVLAVANTHPAEELQEANQVVASLEGLNLDTLAKRLWEEPERDDPV